MKRALLILSALLGLASSALSQTRALPPGEIRANGDITFGNALKLGKREGNKTVITPDTLQILGSGSTGDASALSSLLRGSTKPLALSDDTASGYSVARFGSAGVAVCSGNDGIDDSIPINAAVSYVASIGGGKITFPVAADCRVKNPILAKNAVRLVGQGAYPNKDGILGATIRPAVNMTSLITQADFTNPVINFQVEHLTLDGRAVSDSNAYAPGRTVTYAIDLSCLSCKFEENAIMNMGGGGIQLRNPSPYISWINWITANQFYRNSGWSARLETTDSVFANNIVSNCGVKGTAGAGNTATQNGSGGCIWTKNFGNIRFIGNQIEGANVGVLEESVDAGAYPAYGNTYVGNYFDLNNTAFQMKLGALGAGSNISFLGNALGNRFANSTDIDISVPDRVVNGYFSNNHLGTIASTAAHYRFASGTLNPGWRIGGQFAFSGSQRIQNAPDDLILEASGSGGAAWKVPSLQVGPDTGGAQPALKIVAANAAPTPALEFWAGSSAAAATRRARTYYDPATGNLQSELGGVASSRVLFNGSTQFQTAVGFNGATPTGKCTLSTALPTDGSATNANIATAINSIRSCLINNGLAQ